MCLSSAVALKLNWVSKSPEWLIQTQILGLHHLSFQFSRSGTGPRNWICNKFQVNMMLLVQYERCDTGHFTVQNISIQLLSSKSHMIHHWQVKGTKACEDWGSHPRSYNTNLRLKLHIQIFGHQFKNSFHWDIIFYRNRGKTEKAKHPLLLLFNR